MRREVRCVHEVFRWTRLALVERHDDVRARSVLRVKPESCGRATCSVSSSLSAAPLPTRIFLPASREERAVRRPRLPLALRPRRLAVVGARTRDDVSRSAPLGFLRAPLRDRRACSRPRTLARAARTASSCASACASRSSAMRAPRRRRFARLNIAATWSFALFAGSSGTSTARPRRSTSR